jgi:prolyl oligopeptidase
MKKSFLFTVLILVFIVSCATKQPVTTSNMNQNEKQITYPTTKRDESVTDNYHGNVIKDPYRWLENDTSTETRTWVKAENKVTFDYLAQITSRGAIKSRLEKIWNFEKFGAPFKEGGKYYFFKNSGLQNQSVLYRQESLSGEPVVVIDPNALSKEGTVALGTLSFNREGSLLAYQLAKAGSDWQTIYVKDLKTNTDLEDKIDWVKFSGISWQGNGFYYSRYPTPAKGMELTAKSEFHQVWFHKIGTKQTDDVLVYDNKEHANYNHGIYTSENEKYLFLSVSESTSGDELYFSKPDAPSKWVPIAQGFANDYGVLDEENGILIVKTNKNAPKYRLVAIDVNHPEEANWKVLIPESDDVLQGAEIVGGKIVCQYLHNACSKVKVFETSGKYINELTLPGIGTVGGVSGKKKESEAFFSFASFTRPNSIYQLDMKSLESKLFKAPTLDFKSEEYETKQVFYPSKDGTKIPMFLTFKKGTKLDGTAPTLLYAYGGFNISMLPGFAITRTVLLENGGIYAVANLRGGGEFGEDWHKAGTKERKQNVFDDFIAAAEYLIANKYTSKSRLAIEGGSNGGLLVGACMTQRPDLFKVCFPRVGVLDMLRYHQFTIGRAWSADYGLSETPEGFKYLSKYSPLHNVKKIAYPSTMITTGDHDDRVVPAHSFKFAAELQSKQQGKNPALIRIETSGGHGAGKPTSKVIEEAADMIAFMFHEMGIVVN